MTKTQWKKKNYWNGVLKEKSFEFVMLETFKLNINKTCLFKFKVKQCGKKSVSFLNMPEMKKKRIKISWEMGGGWTQRIKIWKIRLLVFLQLTLSARCLPGKTIKTTLRCQKKGIFQGLILVVTYSAWIQVFTYQTDAP